MINPSTTQIAIQLDTHEPEIMWEEPSLIFLCLNISKEQ